ncbi:hypothetical protein L596_004572 [Steinernema carpocapsae]|uniref:Uncharacterized protein n=1 Tax=Steinernema carpocapsae TaxID=34508 RepID=A0A4U8UW79_STECR|nr:hypothetical protein L596_004572 [Steinernema carpocapsae]
MNLFNLTTLFATFPPRRSRGYYFPFTVALYRQQRGRRIVVDVVCLKCRKTIDHHTFAVTRAMFYCHKQHPEATPLFEHLFIRSSLLPLSLLTFKARISLLFGPGRSFSPAFLSTAASKKRIATSLPSEYPRDHHLTISFSETQNSH